MRQILLNDDPIYAITLDWDDQDWNNKEQTLTIIRTKEEYDRLTKEWNEIQPYTGQCYKVLYIKK